MILPSGQAVRVHRDKLNEINEAIDNVHKKRKRKSTSEEIHVPKSPAFEVLSKTALMNLMPPPQTPKLGILGKSEVVGSNPARDKKTFFPNLSMCSDSIINSPFQKPKIWPILA